MRDFGLYPSYWSFLVMSLLCIDLRFHFSYILNFYKCLSPFLDFMLHFVSLICVFPTSLLLMDALLDILELGFSKIPLLQTMLFSSVQFSHSVVSDSLQPHESQHARQYYNK